MKRLTRSVDSLESPGPDFWKQTLLLSFSLRLFVGFDVFDWDRLVSSCCSSKPWTRLKFISDAHFTLVIELNSLHGQLSVTKKRSSSVNCQCISQHFLSAVRFKDVRGDGAFDWDFCQENINPHFVAPVWFYTFFWTVLFEVSSRGRLPLFKLNLWHENVCAEHPANPDSREPFAGARWHLVEAGGTAARLPPAGTLSHVLNSPSQK